MSNHKHEWPPDKWRQFFEIIRAGHGMKEAVAMTWGDGRKTDTVYEKMVRLNKKTQFTAAVAERSIVRAKRKRERSPMLSKAYRKRMKELRTPEEHAAWVAKRREQNAALRRSSPRRAEYERLRRKSCVIAKAAGIDPKEIRKAWGIDVGPKWYCVDYSQHDVEVND